MKVKKRNGSLVPLDLNKFHDMVSEACNGLSGVSASQVEMSSGIQFYDGITTKEIQEILIKSASDLISLDNPNYQYVAARLLLFSLRKDVYGQFEPLPLLTIIKRNIDIGLYDKAILEYYSKEEIQQLQGMVKFDRDFLFTYAGLRQVCDKYLVQDRSTTAINEVPQYMYILIAATLFSQYPKNTRMGFIKRYYDAISQFKISLPTPIIAGVRTPLRQYNSCVLIDVDDTLDSIFSSNTAIGKYIAQRSGIGINVGRIRGINSKIRGGEVQHTGLIPFLKMFEATTRSCTQNGIRGGNSSSYYTVWNSEIEDIIVLKNNKGTEDNRVRRMDHVIQFSKLFYERFLNNENITLFSTNDVPGLYDAFGTDTFDELYIKYETMPGIKKKTISAVELFTNILQERSDTGRIYLMNIDHANSHSAFKDKISMSNLCVEITLPTTPIQHIDDENGEIATCILSAINLGVLKNLDDMEDLCDLAVRGLDALIDYQDYPVKAAELFSKSRRSLGIGYIGLAHYLAKNKLSYEDSKAVELMHKTTEAFQYYLIKASVNLAKEFGACEKFNRTKYSDGILPIDTYKKDVDTLCDSTLFYDWETLRKDILSYGMRNSTLSAAMPAESSAVVSNETNGVEPPRDFISVKKSKKGPLKQVVPGFHQLKNFYTLLWDMKSNDGYLQIMAVIQKFYDQSISTNTSYNPQHYADNMIPMSILIKDMLNMYKWGLKTVYYQNTYDGMEDESVETKKQENIQIVKEYDMVINTVDEDEFCESCAI